MQITISGHHVEVTSSLKNVTQEKIKKLCRHHPDLHSVNVIFTLEKHSQIIELGTHYLGVDITAKSIQDDMYHAITNVTDKFDKLLSKRKSTVKAHPHQKLLLDGDADWDASVKSCS